MKTEPITLETYPSAILHIDGDAFFTSVEQSVNPSLKGRPVVTGKERGIISCSSYEARAMNIKRGVSLRDAKKICPDLVVLPSDYETYSLFSKRMFDIFREFTPFVEEYSIDEGFADISGMRRVFRSSYKQIAQQVQKKIEDKLDITVSVGLSLTKGLAKLASDFIKPRGITAVPGRFLHRFLPVIDLGDVWGMGPNSTALMAKYGVKNAYQFIQRPEVWVRRLLGKPGADIWNELRGTVVNEVNTEEKKTYASLSKSKTFSKPTDDGDFVYAKLMRNLESAFIKLRRYDLRTREIHCVLRKKDFSQVGLSARLSRGTSSTHEAAAVAKSVFDKLYEPGADYRCTMVVLEKLESDDEMQYELFGDNLEIEKLSKLSKVTDDINHRFGKHHVTLATSLYLKDEPKSGRGEAAWRKANLLKGETARKRIGIPRLNIEL